MKIAIIKGLLVSYSVGFYDRLLAKKELDITIYTQEKIPGLNLKTAHHKYPNHVKLVKNITLNKEKASWQFLPWREIYQNYDVYVITGNPRNLSNVCISSFLKICGKKVVLWTMGHSFDSNPINEKLRLFWTSFFDYILLYTDAEVDSFRKMGFHRQYMLGQNNGLDQVRIDRSIMLWNDLKLSDWQEINGIKNKDVLLSCSRLTKKNNFEQVVEALSIILKSKPDVVWVIIGDGEEENSLKRLVEQMDIKKSVLFVGAIYEEESLSPWFLSAKMLVHPAAIGLSLLHAFGYGLPVITHSKKQLHGPEYAAFKEGETGFGIVQNNIKDLAEKIILTLSLTQDQRLYQRKCVQKIAREDYNVDVMVERFVQIINKAAVQK